MEILYRDDRVVVCEKPQGVLSTDEPGGLPGLLRAELGLDTLHTVHRLDRVVGGLMVLACTRRAARELGEQLRTGRFEKRYLAVCTGIPVAPEGELCDLLVRDRQRRRTETADAPGPGVQAARLRYRTLAVREGFALTEVTLITGRTHQIRAQFAAHGLPLWGDVKYGGVGDAPALYSAHIAFDHPRTGERLCFDRRPAAAPPWSWFEESE